MREERELDTVVLHYKDGITITLSGKDLRTWIKTVDTAMVLASVHGLKDPEYEKLWKKIETRLKKSKTYP